ncbi:MAG: hypothetical protein AAF378_01560 [Cyanobacteria bacterium P01_A01_bin.84]
MMLAQFQSLYPQGSLISELLQIHNGKHIVQVTIQIEGITRATGMAGSETVEEAEDRARERALSLLSSQTVTLQPESSSSELSEEEKSNRTTNSNQNDISKDVSIPQNLPKNISGKEETLSVSQTLKSDRELDTKENLTNLSNNPATEEKLSPIPLDSLYSSATSKQEILLSETSESSNVSNVTSTSTNYSEPSEPELLNETKPQSSLSQITSIVPEEESTQKADNTFEPLNQENLLPLISSDGLQSPPDQTSEPAIAGSEETVKATKKKSTTSKRKKKAEQPVDDSDTIAKIGVEMKRLGWTIEDGREHLRKTYNKISRHLLAPEELQDFLHYLELQQPTSLEPLPLDPNF